MKTPLARATELVDQFTRWRNADGRRDDEKVWSEWLAHAIEAAISRAIAEHSHQFARPERKAVDAIGGTAQELNARRNPLSGER